MNHTDKFRTLSVQELRQRIGQNQDFVLLDTLTSEHFEKVHLPGATNACVFEVVFSLKIQNLIQNKQQAVVVYGSSDTSYDAIAAAEKLDRLGYQNVIVLLGGIKAWRDAGYPLEGHDLSAIEENSFLQLENRSYLVDTAQSVIEWTGRNPNTRHYGTLELSKGAIHALDGILTGSFEMDIRSIKNLNLEGDELQPVLISHLLSDDFFFADKFPTVSFEIEVAKQVANPTMTAPNYLIEGTLNLRGFPGKIKFPATVNTLANGSIAAEAHFDIDRTQWNIIYGSSRFFEHLGMHVVFDLISLQVRIIAN